MMDKMLKDIKNSLKIQNKSMFVKQNLPYLVFWYIGNILSHHVQSYVGGDVIDKIFQGILELSLIHI